MDDIRIGDIPNTNREHYTVTSGLKFDSFKLNYYINPDLSTEATTNLSWKRHQQSIQPVRETCCPLKLFTKQQINWSSYQRRRYCMQHKRNSLVGVCCTNSTTPISLETTQSSQQLCVGDVKHNFVHLRSYRDVVGETLQLYPHKPTHIYIYTRSIICCIHFSEQTTVTVAVNIFRNTGSFRIFNFGDSVALNRAEAGVMLVLFSVSG
jgi:hypothetical protein